MKKIIFIILLTSIVMVACKKKSTYSAMPIADGSGAPILPELPYDYSDRMFNSNNLNNNEVALGRVLFYDKNLSFNNTISCGSCHVQSKGFADDVQFHKGVYGNTLTRNTLAISGDGSDLFWDGRSDDLNDLVLRPISNHNEMVQDLSKLCNKLSNIEYYKKLFNYAYGDETITIEKINSSIASFCKTLKPSQTKFDKAFNFFGNVNISELSLEELNGFQVFNQKGKCSSCHNLANTSFYVGNQSISGEPLHNTGLDVNYADNGKGSLTRRENDEGMFKSPNLRNVALTEPYMHDGRFKTLEEVVEFYNSGVMPHKNLDFVLCDLDENNLSNMLDSLIDAGVINPQNNIELQEALNKLIGNRRPARLNLTDIEKRNLVSFLKTLTDHNLAVDPRFSNPFKN